MNGKEKRLAQIMKQLIARIKNANYVAKLVHVIVGSFTYPGIAIINKIEVTGTEHIDKLPKNNVLFVCNHQTYFMDVITLYHVFSALKWGKKNKLGLPYYLLNPFTRVNYVAAEQTMKSNWMARLFMLAGGLTVRRTWNASSTEKRAGLDPSDTRKIERSLLKNWIITFPQGTTTPFAPARRGTALIIKHHHPIVIPVVIDGFSKAFNKTGVLIKKKGTRLTVNFKPPLTIDFEASAGTITEQLMDSIEQSNAFMPEILKQGR